MRGGCSELPEHFRTLMASSYHPYSFLQQVLKGSNDLSRLCDLNPSSSSLSFLSLCLDGGILHQLIHAFIGSRAITPITTYVQYIGLMV